MIDFSAGLLTDYLLKDEFLHQCTFSYYFGFIALDMHKSRCNGLNLKSEYGTTDDGELKQTMNEKIHS